MIVENDILMQYAQIHDINTLKWQVLGDLKGPGHEIFDLYFFISQLPLVPWYN
jgi:hypothetical protein